MLFPVKEFEKTSCRDADVYKEPLSAMFSHIIEEDLNIHQMMLIRDGAKVFSASATGFDEHDPHPVYSVAKSLTSLAIGMLYDDKRIDLDQHVSSYLSSLTDDIPEEYENLTIRHLLTMTTGQKEDIFMDLKASDDLIGRFFTVKRTHPLGKHFFYNNYATFLLSVIVTELTNKTLNDFLHERMFRPLNIDQPTWNEIDGYTFGASGLKLTLTDMGKIGVLLLSDGMWNDQRIVSKNYLDMATNKQVDTTHLSVLEHNKDGYGFGFWMNHAGGYRAAGLHNQLIIVHPETHAVFVTQAYEKQSLYPLFENYVLPALEKPWHYTTISLKDEIRTFKAHSIDLIKKENDERN